MSNLFDSLLRFASLRRSAHQNDQDHNYMKVCEGLAPAALSYAARRRHLFLTHPHSHKIVIFCVRPSSPPTLAVISSTCDHLSCALSTRPVSLCLSLPLHLYLTSLIHYLSLVCLCERRLRLAYERRGILIVCRVMMCDLETRWLYKLCDS